MTTDKHGDLDVIALTHERQYAKGLVETLIWSARSPFDATRKRLKAIVTRSHAECWQRFFVMHVSNGKEDVAIYVDRDSGNQVTNVIPVIISDGQININPITNDKFTLLFFSMNINSTEDVTVETNGHDLLWRAFYSNAEATEGVAVSALNGQPIYASVSKS